MQQDRFHNSIDDRINGGDVSLFDAIRSETTDRDRRSLLACQAAVRRHHPSYVYLEIGSHLGGSLQTHVADPACAIAHSIDPRPAVQADARGSRFAYPENSTARMLANLGPVGDVSRVRCHEASASAIPPSDIAPAPHYCFIDGEHTDAAVAVDFALCRQVATGARLIAFHDAYVVYNGLWNIVETLEAEGQPFRACVLPDSVFVIALGEGSILDDPAIRAAAERSYRGYLFSLRATDAHRQFANHPLFRAWRKLRSLVARPSR